MKLKSSIGCEISDVSSLLLLKKHHLLTTGEGEYSKVLWCFVPIAFCIVLFEALIYGKILLAL